MREWQSLPQASHVYAADSVSVCDGVDLLVEAFFSVGTLFCCCFHHPFLASLELCAQRASPVRAVRCQVFPGVCVDVQVFHVHLADILEPEFGSPCVSFPSSQFPVENVLGNTPILHSTHMTQPAQPALPQEGVHAGQTCAGQDFSVGHFVLLGDAENT